MSPYSTLSDLRIFMILHRIGPGAPAKVHRGTLKCLTGAASPANLALSCRLTRCELLMGSHWHESMLGWAESPLRESSLGIRK